MGTRMDAEGGNLPLASDTHSEPVSVPSQYDKPHIPEKCRAGLVNANADKPLAQYSSDPAPLLDRLRGGDSVRKLSEELGVSATAFYAWLIRNAPEEFLAITAGRSLARIEQAEADLDVAGDQLAVSKARESARLSQWNLERANRKLFGDNKAEVGGVTVQVLIAPEGGETQARVIEAER